MPSEPVNYIGRFAPSPTGPLHFGSLVSAVASYLDARANQGRWLVRIEDIDPPREIQGAAETILNQLISHGLTWDGEVLYQSQRTNAYHEALQQLRSQRRLYPCTCSRQDIKARNGHHGPACRESDDIPDQPHAWRVAIGSDSSIGFKDRLQGVVNQDLNNQTGDFILLRKDGLFAYQLAVAVDDTYQDITHVVRGCDLLDSTPRQIFLQKLLGYTTPNYCHTPVAVDRDGNKLSKQNLAPAIDVAKAEQNLTTALLWLKLPLPKELHLAPCTEQLSWAQQHWRLSPLLDLEQAEAPNTPY